VTFDYYNRRSEDLLLGLPIPAVTGFGEALVNQGIVENKGFELELRVGLVSNSNFSWNTSAILTRNENKLVDFAGSSGLIKIVDSKRPAEWIALEGQPISSFYGYVVKEEIDLQYIKNPFYPINGQSQDIYVKDLNGDGLIDTDDRTILGSPYPDLIWSLQGSHGAEVRNISSQYIKQEFSGNQDYTDDFPDADLVEEAQNLIYMMADNYVGYNPEGIDQGRDSPLTYGYQRGPAPIYRTISAGLNLQF